MIYEKQFFDDFESVIRRLSGNSCKIFSFGKTISGKKLFGVEIGNGPKTVLLQYGMHAREWITSFLAIEHAKLLLSSMLNSRIIICPMMNPDGISLCKFGRFEGKIGDFQYKANGDSLDFSLWKANARGVDLNNNFNAKFSKHVSSFVPASQGYAGEFPESEPETKALIDLCKNVKPDFTISFHTKGEEIYYDFFQKKSIKKRDYEIARIFADDFGYSVVSAEKSSSGGFKDWCIEYLKIPSITIELGCDAWRHPIGLEHLESLKNKTKSLPETLKKVLEKI